MIVIPVDIECTVHLIIIAFAFELFRIIAAFILARPSGEVIRLEADKYEAQLEVAKIKSVQLEFVKHSLLTRKVISIEKKIEQLQALYTPRLLLVRKFFRIFRIIAYAVIGIVFKDKSVVLVNPLLLWPLSWFTYKATIALSPWFVIIIFAGTSRHILRTILPLIFSRTTFP